jgi:hypothetical protein
MSSKLLGLKVALVALEYLEARGIRLSDIAAIKAAKGDLRIQDLEALESVSDAARQRALDA